MSRTGTDYRKEAMEKMVEKSQVIIASLPEHIASKIRICEKSGCWIFEGKDPSSNGYQRVRLYGIRFQAHRLIYEMITKEDIRGKELDHVCENRPCCNPWHMDPVTPKINSNRKYRRRKKAPTIEQLSNLIESDKNEN